MSTTTTQKQSTAQRVLAIIEDDPGVSLQHIQTRLGDVTNKQVGHSLRFLRRTEKIVNLGKHAKGASWYPKNGN